MSTKKVIQTVALASLLALPASAQVSNTGAPIPDTASPNALTADLPEGVINILYVPSNNLDDPAYRAAIAAITGGVVDYMDGGAVTPSLAMLSTYDCVHTWANQAYADATTMGDNLADYVDAGGHVVLGAFVTFTTGNALAGRIMTPAYNPVTSPTGGNHFLSSNYAGDGTTPIHAGVAAYECTFRDMLALQGSGMQDGSYVDGEIAHSYRPDFNVVHSNGSGDASLACTGDWALLIANSCLGTPVPVELQSFRVE